MVIQFASDPKTHAKTVEFRLVSPRPEVEIHLPDGRVLSGARNAPVGDFLKTLEFSVPVVAADVDNELRELTYPIQMEATVRPIIMSDPDGALIYRRSLNFLLEMAFADLFPERQIANRPFDFIWRLLLPDQRPRTAYPRTNWLR